MKLTTLLLVAVCLAGGVRGQVNGSSVASSETQAPVVPTGGITFFLPPPTAAPVPPATTAAGVNTTSNNTGPTAPVEGTNMLLVMTLPASSALNVVAGQKALKQQVANLAQVPSDDVYFYNRTTRTDPRTGTSTLDLQLNVVCQSTDQCKGVGARLFNSTNQAALTQALAQNQISVIPGTIQVYGSTIPEERQGAASITEADVALPEPAPVPVDTTALTTPGGVLNGTLGALDTGVASTAGMLGGLTGLNLPLPPGYSTGMETTVPPMGTTNGSVLLPAEGVVTAENATTTAPAPVAPAPAPATPETSGATSAAASAAAMLVAAAALLL